MKDLKDGAIKPLDMEQAKRGLLWLRKAEEKLEATEGVNLPNESVENW